MVFRSGYRTLRRSYGRQLAAMRPFISTILLALGLAFGSVAFGRAQADDRTTDPAPVHALVRFKIRALGMVPLTGRFTSVAVHFAPNPETDRVTVAAIVKSASVATSNSTVDKLLRSERFFNVERFPEVSFEACNIDLNQQGETKITGTLKLRNVAWPTVFDVAPALSRNGTNAGYLATAHISRSAFGMGAMKFAVSDDVTIEVLIPKRIVLARGVGISPAQ